MIKTKTMYTPYLRGRLYELQALDDMAFRHNIYGKVLPIIEPVVLTDQVAKSYHTLASRNIPFVLVSNPKAGDLTKDDVDKRLINGSFDGYDQCYVAFLISRQSTLTQIQNFVEKYGDRKISFIHYEVPGPNDEIVPYLNSISTINHNIFVTPHLTQRYVDSILKNGAKRITIVDPFNKLISNAAYAAIEEEPFSNLHYSYKGMGFDGFGDFSIMGEKFEEGGGRPRAVVIHWFYIQENGSLWIRHFVSDETTGTENIAGKFDQAYQKLSSFCTKDPLHLESIGCIEISNVGEQGKNPQLGAIKKYSMMHHFELVSTLIN